MRIVSMALNVPGPVAVSRAVADGARAIKIEPPSGDPLERFCQPWYDALHAGVEVHRLDLKTAAGMTQLRHWLAESAVFVASNRPAALTRLGLDAAALRRDYPRLSHLNIVGDTSRPEESGHDLTYQARAGLAHDAQPITLLADMAGGERAHAAIKDLVREPGSHRVVGLFDALRDLATPLRYGLMIAGGSLSGGDPTYRLYRTKAGTIAVAALEPHFRSRLYEGLALPEGEDLSEIFATRTAVEWEQWAASRDIPIVRCLTPNEVSGAQP